jgi:hypothetical protein
MLLPGSIPAPVGSNRSRLSDSTGSMRNASSGFIRLPESARPRVSRCSPSRLPNSQVPLSNNVWQWCYSENTPGGQFAFSK